MSCEATRTALSAYLDGELADAQREEIRLHLSGCAACTAAYETLRAVSDRSRAFFYEAVDSLGDLRETESRVVAESTLALRSEAGGRRRRRRWIVPVILALVVLVSLVWMFRRDAAHRGLEAFLLRMTAPGQLLRLSSSTAIGEPVSAAAFELWTDGQTRFRARPWLPLAAWPEPTRAGHAGAWFGADGSELWVHDPAAVVVRRTRAAAARSFAAWLREDPSIWSHAGHRGGAAVSVARALALLRGAGRDPDRWRRVDRDLGRTVTVFELREVEPGGEAAVTLRLTPRAGADGHAEIEFGAWCLRIEVVDRPPAEACHWREVVPENTKIRPLAGRGG